MTMLFDSSNIPTNPFTGKQIVPFDEFRVSYRGHDTIAKFAPNGVLFVYNDWSSDMGWFEAKPSQVTPL